MKREVKIGLTVLLGVLAVYLIITWAKSSHLFAGNQKSYQLVFQDVSGLKEGDPVRVYGYPSGKVDRIAIRPGGAQVRIYLDADVELFSDASAEVRVKEIMGGKMVELFPGSEKTPLDPAAVIPGSASLDFSTAFARAGDFMDQLSGDDLDSLITNFKTISKVLAKVSTDLEKEGVSDLVSELSEASHTLNQILRETHDRSLIRKMDELLADAGDLSKKADGAIASITQLSDRVQERTLPEAEKMLQQANQMLTEAEDMMSDAKDLVAQLKDRRTVAGKLLYDPDFAVQLDKTLENLNVTLDHIRTKKIFVTMTLSKKQREFSEEIK